MRAVVLLGHGDLDQLEYRSDVPRPAPKRGEVLIRVAAAAVNNTDINLRVGWYSRRAQATADDAGWAGDALAFPRIQGADACGYILEVGEGIDSSRIGERVIVDPVLRTHASSDARPAYFGSDCDGAFAEFAVVPAANAVAIRSPLTDVELASFPCSYLAAENMLSRARVAAGERVLVTGASGGVGSATVQLARRRGAQVIALAASAKAAHIAALGAERILDRDADLIVALGRESVDVVIDSVGGVRFSSVLGTLRRNGRCALAGAMAGPVVEIDLRTVYLQDLDIFGCTIPKPGIFRDLVGYIERAEIKPLVSATYAMSEIRAAQKAFQAKSHVGKIVLVPG